MKYKPLNMIGAIPLGVEEEVEEEPEVEE